jgi:hypothetical protein
LSAKIGIAVLGVSTFFHKEAKETYGAKELSTEPNSYQLAVFDRSPNL